MWRVSGSGFRFWVIHIERSGTRVRLVLELCAFGTLRVAMGRGVEFN